uniref:Uncharacterized protein n=1 Tax=Ditylenchus dipsaci TaxID=166011 RepID=A0A915EJ34_9BILA
MSSIGTDEESEKWLDIDDNLSIPTQTVDEILAEGNDFLDEELSGFEDDDSFLFALDRASSHSLVPISYRLGSPINIQKEESISHQILSVKERPTGGTASALAVCTSHLAVGTTRGLTLIFERSTKKLAQFVHVGQEYGRGGLVIFGCHTKKVINEYKEIVQAGRGILHVKYVLNSALILVDNGGSVFEVHERVGKKRNARCIFTGCKGEVVNINVIASDELILLASLKQVLVLSIKRGAVIAQLRLNGPSIAPPLLDWRKRVLQVTSRASVKDLRICLARGSDVRIHQIQPTTVSGNIICPLLKVIKVPNGEVAINIKWVDDFHVMVLTSREVLHLIEIQKGVLIASTEASDAIDLVYNSADFKGLATGGNVSAAMEACLRMCAIIDHGGISKGNVNELVEHYKSNILVLQRACVATSHFNLLYNTVYPRLEKDPLSRSIFLELLDEIISDELLDQPPASLVHDYLTYLIAEGQFSQFELAVTKLPIDRLDIHK